MTTEQKVNIAEEATEALKRIKAIYEDFDMLNAHLYELSETLDKDEHAYFHMLWESFPTYNTLDDLKRTLTDLGGKDE